MQSPRPGARGHVSHTSQWSSTMAVRQKGRGRDKHRSGSFGVKPSRPPRGEVWRLPVVRGRHRPRVPGDERRRDEGRPLARARACPPHLRVVGATAICPGRRQAINPAHQPTNQVRSIYHCRGRQGRCECTRGGWAGGRTDRRHYRRSEHAPRERARSPFFRPFFKVTSGPCAKAGAGAPPRAPGQNYANL